MKIKRVFAQDTREAMRIIKESLGDDAVILSNKRVEGGIELVAAVDYDEEFVNGLSGEQAPTPPSPPPASSAQADAGEASEESFSSYMAQTGIRAYQNELNPAPEPEARPPEEPSPQPRTQQRPAKAPAKPAAPRKPANKIIWSQEPVIMEMRRELKQLRHMLQTQLTGIAWNNMSKEHPVQTGLLRRLMALGLSPAVCRQITAEVGEVDQQQAWRKALGLLARSIPIMSDDILARGGIVALMGPTGVGKTTTIAKLAAWFALRHGRSQVALVTTDNFRIGAHEQLRNFARIMDVPVRAVGNWEELRDGIRSLSDRKLVLIDTAGMSQRDQRLPEQFTLLNESNMPIHTYLVLSAVTHLAGMEEIVRIYNKTKPKGCIITKLDECASLGGALSMAIQHRLPVAYISDGQQVPEDLHLGRRNNLVNRAVTITRNSGRAVENEALEQTFGEMAVNAHLG